MWNHFLKKLRGRRTERLFHLAPFSPPEDGWLRVPGRFTLESHRPPQGSHLVSRLYNKLWGLWKENKPATNQSHCHQLIWKNNLPPEFLWYKPEQWSFFNKERQRKVTSVSSSHSLSIAQIIFSVWTSQLKLWLCNICFQCLPSLQGNESHQLDETTCRATVTNTNKPATIWFLKEEQGCEPEWRNLWGTTGPEVTLC